MERTGPRAFAAFVDVAAASAAETDYLLMLTGELSYAKPSQIAPLCEELNQIRRMLTTLRNGLRSRARPSS
jgi:four helix bundle protein